MSKRGVVIRKVDGNQARIVKELRAAGYGVLDIHIIGNGAPDLVVSDRHNHTVLVEVKDIGGRYTQDEIDFAQCWPAEIVIAFSARDVEEWFTDRCNQ